ncbi:HD domain-containing protein [Thermosynechococcaceae cyanobacterium BACA0444]|uniref:HD domain-containing protein n=1 Tax=Pseudocalidococcus azoricus BACA0444 TaxID=2918990 RepID=A0AAE4JV60_9CYAN|nr:HD domain-containing protein [Pseudocalidococcus azoricus]MDS3860085.1 HD domain-containing protein [Pseudocalidococcus azoricus BACA0444]
MLPSRTYHDPLHGAITLDGSDPVEKLLIRLIDTPACQRLRRIRQLGTASLTFHGAEASRFTHSLGVMQIARRAFDRLAKRYSELRPYRPQVLVAALLHDLGHGPFSHTAEEIFQGQHEHWTRRIFLESSPLRQALDEFHPQLATDLEKIYLKQFPIPLVWQLVTSQLDCDRLDYLMRDSYFTGASYGHLDLDRILMAMDYDPVSQELTVNQKGLAAIEHYLFVRYFMYAQIYNHPKNLAAAWGLEQAISRARELFGVGQVWADGVIGAWLTQNNQELSLEQYLGADDITLVYHLQAWQHHSDAILADLCRRYLDRDLLKAWDISNLSDSGQQSKLTQARELAKRFDLDPAYYVTIRTAVSRGYTLYNKGIKVKSPRGLVDINQCSSLVMTLTQPLTKQYLLYPREIEADLQRSP